MRRPVFVDQTGRRRRAAIVLGSGLGVVLIIGLIMLTAGLVTGSPLPIPGWPDAAQVDDASPTPVPAPTPAGHQTVRKTTAPSPTTAEASSAPGNSNGNGHGRPTKTPGKP